MAPTTILLRNLRPFSLYQQLQNIQCKFQIMTSWPLCGSFTAHGPLSGPFAAHGPLNICHGPQGCHFALFGKPLFRIISTTTLKLQLLHTGLSLFEKKKPALVTKNYHKLPKLLFQSLNFDCQVLNIKFLLFIQAGCVTK